MAGSQDRPALRRDALLNLEKLRAAAVEVFREHGLDTPLEGIAQRAGVSVGTLYNRFGSRAGLIDAVAPELATVGLEGVLDRVQAGADPWERFALFVELTCELQASDPVLNDAVSRRYADTPQLAAVCDASLEHARGLIADAQRDGSLRPEFTDKDLFMVFWSNAALVRATHRTAPDAWRRGVGFLLDGLRVDAGRAPVADLASLDNAPEAMAESASGG